MMRAARQAAIRADRTYRYTVLIPGRRARRRLDPSRIAGWMIAAAILVGVVLLAVT